MDFATAQRLVWQNKLDKGFGTTDVPLEFCLRQGEVAEGFEAWYKGRGNLGEELADVAIYLLGLAEMTGVDLGAAVEAKVANNAGRSTGGWGAGRSSRRTAGRVEAGQLTSSRCFRVL